MLMSALYLKYTRLTQIFPGGMRTNIVIGRATGLSDSFSTNLIGSYYYWRYKFIKPLVRKSNFVISKSLCNVGRHNC